MGETEQKRCRDLVAVAFEERMRDIKKLYEKDDWGELGEYGLCIDFVEAGTFEKQRAPYVRYQISYGGPSEEFRIYLNGEVEFWYLDWFDGAKVNVEGVDKEIIIDIVKSSGLEEAQQIRT